MFNVYANDWVQITRGDSVDIPIVINWGNEVLRARRALGEGDKIYFGVMECGQPFENAVIRKILDQNSPKTLDGDPILELRSSDTACLEPGKYYYTVKLHLSEGSVITIIPNTEFFILE